LSVCLAGVWLKRWRNRHAGTGTGGQRLATAGRRLRPLQADSSWASQNRAC